jgi:hypothetical protein
MNHRDDRPAPGPGTFTRLLLVAALLAAPALSGCQSELLFPTRQQPMKSTGAPCGFRAVDAGICPKAGYRVPPGAHY